MRVVVTGGAGFIGSHLSEALARRGDPVLVVDNLSTGRESNLRSAFEHGAQLDRLDVRDGARLTAALTAFRPEAVFHLAAQVDVRKSVADPGFDASVNVVGTVNVLEAARLAGATRVVNTSTGGAIYGDVEAIPTPETVVPAPQSAYGQGKWCAESYCAWANRLYGLSTLALRYGNVFGPRQDPSGEAGVIAIFVGRALSGGSPVVYGDGRQTRDYVYVTDIVEANLRAVERPDVTGAINIGTGVETSVLELVDLVRTAARLPADAFQPQFAPARPGELDRSCLDARLARERLGVVASTPVAEGIARTVAALGDPTEALG